MRIDFNISLNFERARKEIPQEAQEVGPVGSESYTQIAYQPEPNEMRIGFGSY